MSLLLPVTVALWMSAQIPLSTQLQLPTGETVELAADYVLYEPGRQVLTARGHTVLRSGQVLVRADEITYDQTNEVAVAKGNIMLVSGMYAAVADEVTVDIKSYEAQIKGGLFMQKRNVSAEALLNAQTPQELRTLGTTPVLLSGTRIRRLGPDAFEVDGIAFSPCQCDPGTPNWRVEASHATVNLNDHATLSWPVVYVQSVPVFALPWVFLPLAERRSGLLIPRPTQSSLTGFTLEQPVFLALGRSYDMTFTPTYYMGPSEKDVDTRPEVDEPQSVGVRGPRLHTEFRYVPSRQTQGRFSLGLLYDLRRPRHPITGLLLRDEAGNPLEQPRGLRGEASLQHRQELGNGWYDRVDAFFLSDGFYTRDLTADVIVRENQYLRSTGVLYHRGTDHWLGLEVGLRQDIRTAYGFADADPLAPRTFHRLPTLTWAVPERQVLGPLLGSLRVEFSRLAPLLSAFGDEGEDGRYEPSRFYAIVGPESIQYPPDPLQSDGIFNSSDREARGRLDILPRLAASFGVEPYVRATPALSLRQDVYLGELTGRVGQRGYPLLDLTLDSELARTFEYKDTTFRHVVAPSVSLRYVPTVWGGVPTPGASPERPGQNYDEVDTALPDFTPGSSRRFFHGVVEVNQTLRFRRETAHGELIRLTLGQGFDLSRFAPALDGGSARDDPQMIRDTYARFSARSGILGANGVLAYDPLSGKFTQFSADFSISSPRREVLYARYDDLLAVGSERMRRGLDTLVGPVRSGSQRTQLLTAGTALTLGFGMGLRYESIIQPAEAKDSPLLQQVLGVSYGPSCDCWRVEGVARFGRNQVVPDFGFNFSIAGIGSFGTGG
jgi:LPS-assembly protein